MWGRWRQVAGGLWLAFCLITTLPQRAAGQAPELIAVLPVGSAPVPGPPPALQHAWLARIERRFGHAQSPVITRGTLVDRLGIEHDTLAPMDMARLNEVEQQLLRARALSAQLDESGALAVLANAERTLGWLWHVPGVAAFYAEVHTTLGLVAAQAGLDGLALAALRRAAVVDPRRGVRAAEATPAWVERAAAVAREANTGALGEVQITSDAADAQVFVDDVLQGQAPLTVRATQGVHVLRVEARGRRAFGTLLPVDAGARPAVHVPLAVDPILVALDALDAAANVGDQGAAHAALVRARREGVPLRAVWLLELSSLQPTRAVVTTCTPDGCDQGRRLELDAADASGLALGWVLDPAGFGRDRRARDHAWLSEVASPAPTADADAPAWTQRWYVWAAGAAILGGVTALAIAASDEPETQRLRVTVAP